MRRTIVRHAGEWRHLSLPLSCFAASGADLAAVVAPFAVETSGRLDLTIAQVSLVQHTQAGRPPCPQHPSARIGSASIAQAANIDAHFARFPYWLTT